VPIALTIHLRHVKRFLIAAVMFVWLLSAFFSVVNYFVRSFSTSTELAGFTNRFFMGFYVGAEYNFPTWFSSFSLLTSAVIILIIAYIQHVQQEPYTLHWLGLAGFFALFSLDEYVTLHEAAGAILRDFFDLTGVFYYAWPILGAIGIGFVTIFYWRFVAALPLRTRQLFILSTLVIVGGAMGVEIIQGYYTYLQGPANLGYELIAYLEESLELSGMALFIYTFVSHLEIVLAGQSISLFVKR
jgi:hypothetical protein